MADVPPTPAAPPTISVIIPHLNQPELLRRCLDRLAAGHRQPDEIIVVDNGSAVMPHAVCDGRPGLRLLRETVPGPGMARNTGAAAAQGGILAFTDADCLPEPGWLAAAETAMADPGAEILGGDIRIAYVDPARLTRIEAYESVYGYRQALYIRRDGYAATANLVVRAATLAGVGPFGGLSLAEDVDWGRRATAMGHRIRYVPGMRVLHPARQRPADLQAKWDRLMAHAFVASRRSLKGRLAWAVKTAVMAPSPIAEIPTILLSDRVSGLRNRALAFAGMADLRLYRARMMLWLACGGDPATLAGRWNRPPAAKGP